MKSIILVALTLLLLSGVATAAVHYDTNHSAAWTSPFLTGGNSSVTFNLENSSVGNRTWNINGRTLFPQILYTVCDMLPSSPGYQSKNECIDNIIAVKNHTMSTDGAGFGNVVPHEAISAYQQVGTLGYLPKSYNHFSPGRSGGIYEWSDVNSSYLGGFVARCDEGLCLNKTTEEAHALFVSDYAKNKAAAPQLPTYVNHWTNLPYWEDTGDVMLFAVYPFKNALISSIGRGHIILFVDKYIKVYNDVLPGYSNFDVTGKPYIPIIQSLNSDDDAGVGATTLAEGRALRYTLLTMNLKGFTYWADTYRLTNAGLDQNASRLLEHNNMTDELNYLSDILILPTKDYRWGYRSGSNVSFSKTTYNTVQGTNTSNWNWMLKQNGDVHYLIIVNKDDAAVSDVDITVTGLSGAMTARTLGLESAGSTPGIDKNVTDGTFTDSFNGLEAKVYEIAAFDETPPEEEPVVSYQTYVIKGTGGNSTWANYIIEGLQ